jgi:DNA mismatch endonuclease, patch repair protein
MALTRSQNMAQIKAKNTKPELLLRKALWEMGYRYRVHHSIERIRPDIVFIGHKVALFVDGCQWHGCPEHYVFPRTNQIFWGEKLKKNVERDISQTRVLRDAGWFPLRIWEHEIWSDLPGVLAEVTSLLSTGAIRDRENWRLIEVNTIDSANDIERRREVRLEAPLDEKIVERKRSTKKWDRTEHL